MERTTLVKQWLSKIHIKFGVLLELVLIEPDKLAEDETELEFMDEVEALAAWWNHNDHKMVPLVIFRGDKIESQDDIEQILEKEENAKQ